ncbi:MAG: hypothetical protein LBB34_01010 [Holosporales bacterium]|nr:hypothetical protein [Holosporales bacterium]
MIARLRSQETIDQRNGLRKLEKLMYDIAASLATEASRYDWDHLSERAQHLDDELYKVTH